MLLLGLIYYLIANAISYRQDFLWIIVTIIISSLIFQPLLDCLTSIEFVSISLFNDALIINELTGYFIIIVLIITITIDFFYKTSINDSKYVLLLGLIGTLLLLISNSFSIVVLALELQSFSAYLLVASSSFITIFIKSISSVLITSLNYFFWSCLASAFILLGFALIYYNFAFLSVQKFYEFINILNTYNIYNDINLNHNYTQNANNNNIYNDNNINNIYNNIYEFTKYIPNISHGLAIVIIIIGLAFKIGAAPIHFWTPIVYSKIDNRLISFLALVPKIGSLVLLNNLMLLTFTNYTIYISAINWLIVSLSLIIGALFGLKATSFRQLIAYSSINHIGFILILLISINNDLQTSLFFYIAQYSLTLVIVLVAISFTEDIIVYTFYKNKYLFITLTIGILSIAGLPPFIGFFSKLIVFNVAVANGLTSLILIALLSSIVTAYYYLSVLAITFNINFTNNNNKILLNNNNLNNNYTQNANNNNNLVKYTNINNNNNSIEYINNFTTNNNNIDYVCSYLSAYGLSSCLLVICFYCLF